MSVTKDTLESYGFKAIDKSTYLRGATIIKYNGVRWQLTQEGFNNNVLLRESFLYFNDLINYIQERF